MKVVYFYQYFTTPEGSYNPRVYEFARRWVKAGHQVTVVTSWFDRSDLKPAGFVSRSTIDGIQLRVLNIGMSNKHGILHRLYSFLAFAVIASWYAITLPADVVVASSGPITVGLPGLVSRFLRRRPLVFEVRDLWPQGAIEMGFLRNPLLIFMARFLEKCCYRAAAKVVVLSEGMGDWISRTYELDHIAVVPNAADNELFEKLGCEQIPEPERRIADKTTKKTVVYAGNMGPGDDCGQLLDMAKRLREYPDGKDVDVVLIGDGKQGAALRARAQEESIPVRFPGFIARRELIPILSRAQCVVFATKNLPFYSTCSPNKLFDALAAGVPVVQTTQGWIKDLLERENCGLTVRPNDPVGFSGAVMRVLNDPDLSARLGANAKRVAQTLYDRDFLSCKMLAVLLAATRKNPDLVESVFRQDLSG
jgi:glycosyltransferase involved in cell wall biosynthesis